MVSKGWSRDEATNLVRGLEDKVTEFLAAKTEPVPEAPPPEEPMKSFKLHRGKPLEELGQIAGKVAGAAGRFRAHGTPSVFLQQNVVVFADRGTHEGW